MRLDLTESDTPDGTYRVISLETGDIVTSVRGGKGIVETEFTPNSAGGYALVVGTRIVGVVEAVDELTQADMQAIRDLYLAGN